MWARVNLSYLPRPCRSPLCFLVWVFVFSLQNAKPIKLFIITIRDFFHSRNCVMLFLWFSSTRIISFHNLKQQLPKWFMMIILFYLLWTKFKSRIVDGEQAREEMQHQKQGQCRSCKDGWLDSLQKKHTETMIKNNVEWIERRKSQ